MPGVVIITGGSRGIGAETAQLAAVRGYSVCISFVTNKVAADDVVQTIRSAGGTALATQADISVEADVVRLFDEAELSLGPVTALVNNAGILLQQMQLREMSTERLAQVFAVNITGSFMCAREAARRMSTKTGGQGGAIVNVSSLAARLGAPNEYIDYAASKAAMDTMAIGLAGEPSEVASAILYLLSEDASYITGALLDVSGGR